MLEPIGIDLGTTNSVLAASGAVRTLGDATVLPSVVAFPPGGGVLVGADARERRAIDPKNTLYSAKRVIGQTFFAYPTQTFRKSYPFELVDRDGAVGFVTRGGVVTPVDVATIVLRTLVGRAAVDPAAASVVVTVPAGFGPAERAATLRAVRAAGFGATALVEEPVATALAYLNRSRLDYAAVYDLGGGTFDLAILDCTRDPYRVVRHGGDTYLGGDDIDRALAEWAAERIIRDIRWDLRTDPMVFDRLVARCEAAKIRLATAPSTILDLRDVDEAAPTALPTLTLDRAVLYDLCLDLVRRTFGICDQVLAEVGIRASQVDAVFLAGGSTHVPGLGESVGEYFGKKPRRDIDPLHVVAIGASLAAARPALAGLLERG